MIGDWKVSNSGRFNDRKEALGDWTKKKIEFGLREKGAEKLLETAIGVEIEDVKIGRFQRTIGDWKKRKMYELGKEKNVIGEIGRTVRKKIEKWLELEIGRKKITN